MTHSCSCHPKAQDLSKFIEISGGFIPGDLHLVLIQRSSAPFPPLVSSLFQPSANVELYSFDLTVVETQEWES